MNSAATLLERRRSGIDNLLTRFGCYLGEVFVECLDGYWINEPFWVPQAGVTPVAEPERGRAESNYGIVPARPSAACASTSVISTVGSRVFSGATTDSSVHPRTTPSTSSRS